MKQATVRENQPIFAASSAVNHLFAALAERMTAVGEDPADAALWERRKAQAIAALQVRLAEISTPAATEG